MIYYDSPEISPSQDILTLNAEIRSKTYKKLTMF